MSSLYPVLFSFGYGSDRKAKERLIPECKKHKVEIVIDIRENDYAHTYEFNGPFLSRTLASYGIRYIHDVRLGNLRRPNEKKRRLPWHRHPFYKTAIREIVAKLFLKKRVLVMCCEQEAFERIFKDDCLVDFELPHCHRVEVCEAVYKTMILSHRIEPVVVHLRKNFEPHIFGPVQQFYPHERIKKEDLNGIQTIRDVRRR